jgi:DNA polymerase III epsilon subunit-like protein
MEEIEMVVIAEEMKIKPDTIEINDDTKILFFDTETSGFIKKDLSFDHPEQAWTVQIGAILGNQNDDFEKMNIIIKANGRSMNPFAQEVHGISPERADAEGVDELTAAEQFGLMLRQADLMVCHNHAFDWPYVKHLMERNMEGMSDEARSAFYLDLPAYCTMRDKAVVKFCGLKNKANKPKWPKLIELHEILFQEGFDGAHDAFADISATKKCFFALLDLGIITLD